MARIVPRATSVANKSRTNKDTFAALPRLRSAALSVKCPLAYGALSTGERMSQRYDVAGLGNAIVDVIASVDDAFLLTHKIAKGTMALIDEYRAEQLLALLRNTHEVAGGSAANTMAGLASLGARGVFAGKVKDDRLGAVFAASLSSLGVAYSTARPKNGAATASCMIAVTADGQRSMSTYLGACREMTPDDVDEDEIAAAKILYIEGYLWDADGAKAASRKAIAAAKKAGAKVSLTLSDPFCVERFREDFLELMKNDLDILFANEDEARALFEVEDFADVVKAAQRWGGIAALTRSAMGSVIVKGEEVHTVPAAPVAHVIDTTGAGDQFAAGFLFGLTKNKSLAACGKLGALAAAEVISHYGARPETALKDLAAKDGLL
jgi:sugar/nucleoside kinase (ribokinase family)